VLYCKGLGAFFADLAIGLGLGSVGFDWVCLPAGKGGAGGIDLRKLLQGKGLRRFWGVCSFGAICTEMREFWRVLDGF